MYILEEDATETENSTVVQTLMDLVDEQKTLVEESENHGIIEGDNLIMIEVFKYMLLEIMMLGYLYMHAFSLRGVRL